MDNITKLPARFLLATTLILLPLAARATNYYGGILNAALGNAVLSVQGTTLTVDNISHSGNDGVRLDAGGASAIDIQFFEYLKHQTCVVTIATSDAYAALPVVSVGELFGGSNSYARADFSALGSTLSMMQVRDGNGNLLSSARVANAAWVSLDNLFPNPTNGIYVYQVQQGADFTWWRFCTPCLVCTEQVAVVERTLCFRPLDVRRRIPHISGLQLKALGDTAVTSLTLSNENLGLFGHFHHALGQARFDARGDTLGMLNLGGSGNDGVAVLLGRDMNRLKARWNELDPAGAAPPGASFTMAAQGSFTGGVQQALGSMKVQKTAAGMALVNDFTGIGSQSALILVMRNGAQVASFRLNHNTPLPFTGGWPRSGTVGPRLTDLWPPNGPICFYEDWPIDVVLPVAGGSIVGNQIRVLIDDVPQSFAALEAVHFTLGGLPQLVLAGEESSPAGLIFDGLVHAPLGNATLQANAALERLTVSGIGSNGTDGVRILTGGGGGASTKLGVFNPDLLPIDAFLHWAAIDPTDLTLEALTVRRTAAGGALYADFGGLGASTATVALYSNDVLLAYANGIPPTTPVLTFSGGGGLPLNLDPCILHPEDCYGAIDIDIWQPDPIGPIASLVSLPGSAAARGTRVTIQPDPLPVAPAAIQVREIQVTGKNLGTMSLGNSFSVGVHFGANDPPPAGSALAPNDVAGAVPQAHWNNASGPIGSVSGLMGDFNGAAVATTLIVEWTSPNTWSSTGRGEENNGFPPGGDRLLMSGYLDTDNGPGVARVAVFGIDPITASTGYDVIVYILGGVGGRGGAYTIGGTTRYGTAATNPSSHSEDPGLGLADNGTYVRFTGLTGSSFTLIADANTNSPNRNFRAPINGIQIVRSRLAPPEGLVYFGLKHHVLGQAQYSFDTPGALAVENLGSSGNDGVDVQIQELVQSPTPGGPILGIGSPRNAYSVDWVTLNPQPFPPGGGGGGLVFNAWGRLNGGPERLVAWVCQMFAGPSLQLVPDFSALGSGSQEIQLWRDGMLLTRYRVQNNTPAVTTAEWLSGLQLRPASGNFVPPYGPICFYGDWPIVVDILTPSGQHFLANQVRIAIDDVAGSLDALTHVSLQMPGSQRLVFTRESASRVGLNFAGNQHFALGQARLSKTATGALMMENIGPSGSDGMEIQLGRAGFCEVASPSLPLPPPDSSCRYDYRAVVDGLSDRTAATLTMGSAAAGGMLFVADMSPLGATRYTMLVLDGESQVAGLSNQPIAALTISDSAVYVAPSLRWDIQRYKCYIRIHVPKLPGNPGPLIRLGTGAPVSGDNVIILPDDPTRNLGAQTRVLLTATAVHPEPKLFVTEQLGLFAVGHTGLGDATLQARGGTLTIGNLGSNGNDGVELELERSRSFLASFAPLDFQTAQGPYPQPWIQARAFGRFSGMPDHDLGSLRFTALTTGVVRVEADFTPVGSSNHIIEIWRSGALMLRVAGHTGVVATVSAWPAGIGKLGGTDPTVLPCYISPFGALVPITIGGGPTVDGDELRVLTGNPSGTIEELQRLRFQTSGFESFTIENEGFTPALTPRFSQISRLSGGSLQLTIPTVFGYNYSLEAVDAVAGPHPWPWSTFETFFGDGSVKSLVIPATGPRRFIRLRVE